VDELSAVNPVKDYAVSKYKAELGLIERYITIESTMELVIVRPPLVYAGNAPGNFQRLLKLVDLGVPLPFFGVNNKRSMISLNNLTDFLKTCAIHPNARGQLFLISDGDDLSLPEIIRGLASGMGRKPRLFYFPVSVMFTLSKILGKSALMTQLCGSFILNSNKARARLEWTPPFSSRQELVKAARDYKMSSEARRLKSAQSE
jgi:nucleoside-diphosphate-sugar epimerase